MTTTIQHPQTDNGKTARAPFSALKPAPGHTRARLRLSTNERGEQVVHLRTKAAASSGEKLNTAVAVLATVLMGLAVIFLAYHAFITEQWEATASELVRAGAAVALIPAILLTAAAMFRLVKYRVHTTRGDLVSAIIDIADMQEQDREAFKVTGPMAVLVVRAFQAALADALVSDSDVSDRLAAPLAEEATEAVRALRRRTELHQWWQEQSR